jgi:hypothetical protein
MRIQNHCQNSMSIYNDFVFVERFNFLVNLKTGKILKQIMKGGSIGYVIKGKFYSLKRLKQSLVKIEKSDCPF